MNEIIDDDFRLHRSRRQRFSITRRLSIELNGMTSSLVKSFIQDITARELRYVDQVKVKKDRLHEMGIKFRSKGKQVVRWLAVFLDGTPIFGHVLGSNRKRGSK